MQFNVSLFVGVLLGTIALAPKPAPSAHTFPALGTWGAPTIAERRAPASEVDTIWIADAGRNRVESQVERSGAAHRVVATWTPLAETLVPGDAVSLNVTALVVDAAVAADCSVEMVAWQDDGEPVAGRSTRLACTGLGTDAPAGAIAQGIAAWRVPAPSSAPGAALHVRVTVTHRGNSVASTRTYAWMPAGPECAD